MSNNIYKTDFQNLKSFEKSMIQTLTQLENTHVFIRNLGQASILNVSLLFVVSSTQSFITDSKQNNRGKETRFDS